MKYCIFQLREWSHFLLLLFCILGKYISLFSWQIWARVYAALAKANICVGEDSRLNEPFVGVLDGYYYLFEIAVVFAFLDEREEAADLLWSLTWCETWQRDAGLGRNVCHFALIQSFSSDRTKPEESSQLFHMTISCITKSQENITCLTYFITKPMLLLKGTHCFPLSWAKSTRKKQKYLNTFR